MEKKLSGKKLFCLKPGRMGRINTCLPGARGRERADDWLTLGGIIHVLVYGMPWDQAPKEYGPHMTPCNRWKRWSDKGIFLRILHALASGNRKIRTLMIDTTFIKAAPDSRQPPSAASQNRAEA